MCFVTCHEERLLKHVHMLIDAMLMPMQVPGSGAWFCWLNQDPTQQSCGLPDEQLAQQAAYVSAPYYVASGFGTASSAARSPDNISMFRKLLARFELHAMTGALQQMARVEDASWMHGVKIAMHVTGAKQSAAEFGKHVEAAVIGP